VQTRRLAESFQPLNSSLPLSAPELRSHKADPLCDSFFFGVKSPNITGRERVNRSLQGFCTNVFVLRNKTDAFKKLAVWDSFVQKGDTEMFSTLNDFDK